MSEKLTANRAPLGQKLESARSVAVKEGVAASALPVRPVAPDAAARVTVAPTV
jgi:hypothetical protein